MIGGAAGLGYSVATSRFQGGLAAPRGRHRLVATSVTAAACGLAALGLALGGRPLVGGTIHAIAQMSQGSQATLTALGRLIGEPDFGPLTAALIATGEARCSASAWRSASRDGHAAESRLYRAGGRGGNFASPCAARSARSVATTDGSSAARFRVSAGSAW